MDSRGSRKNLTSTIRSVPSAARLQLQRHERHIDRVQSFTGTPRSANGRTPPRDPLVRSVHPIPPPFQLPLTPSCSSPHLTLLLCSSALLYPLLHALGDVASHTARCLAPQQPAAQTSSEKAPQCGETGPLRKTCIASLCRSRIPSCSSISPCTGAQFHCCIMYVGCEMGRNCLRIDVQCSRPWVSAGYRIFQVFAV